MILQTLNDYSKTLLQQGKIEGENWKTQKVYAALHLDNDGKLMNILPLNEKQKPALKLTPALPEKTSNICPGFLCDKAKYLLGIEKKQSVNTIEAFKATKALHLSLLKEGKSDTAKAVCLFFNAWDPETAVQNELIVQNRKLLEKGNLVFFINSEFAHDNPELREIWELHKQKEKDNQDKDNQDKEKKICLVTGKSGIIARTHPKIKNVEGATSSGAALVSFNFDAAKSYGKDQNFNSPVSEEAAKGYTSALNYLLNDSNHRVNLGSGSGLTTVYWTDSNKDQYLDILNMLFESSPSKPADKTDEILNDFFHRLISGKSLNYEKLKICESEPFHILMLAGNNGRISVHLFLTSSFGNLLNNWQAHCMRMRMVNPVFEKSEYVNIYGSNAVDVGNN